MYIKDLNINLNLKNPDHRKILSGIYGDFSSEYPARMVSVEIYCFYFYSLTSLYLFLDRLIPSLFVVGFHTRCCFGQTTYWHPLHTLLSHSVDHIVFLKLLPNVFMSDMVSS
jgi:hypothetical protein